VYEDGDVLLDLPLPVLPGRFQIDNAGTAIATVRWLRDRRLNEKAIECGLKEAEWPARLQRLGPGRLMDLVPAGTELWLDGGHNPSAGRAVAQSLADLDEKSPRPLVLVTGMLRTKEAQGFFRPFQGLASRVYTVRIPGEENAFDAEELAAMAREERLSAEPCPSIEAAVTAAAASGSGPNRVLICGSLYLAGRVLAAHRGEAGSAVSGAAR
jgi:dihydrofolate synthase/folylpolyglutamate synthase